MYLFKEANIRPALTYGSKYWAMKVTNKREIATTEMRMLRGILGVSRREQMRNEEIRSILHITTIDEVKCAVAVFVGLDMSRDETQTTRPAKSHGISVSLHKSLLISRSHGNVTKSHGIWAI